MKKKRKRAGAARTAVMNFTFTKGGVDRALYHQYAAAAMQALLIRGMNAYGQPDDSPREKSWPAVIAMMAHRAAAEMVAAEPKFETATSSWQFAGPPKRAKKR